jgi:hypothetical protein
MSGINGDEDEQPANKSANNGSVFQLANLDKIEKLTKQYDCDHYENHQDMMIPKEWDESYCLISTGLRLARRNCSHQWYLGEGITYGKNRAEICCLPSCLFWIVRRLSCAPRRLLSSPRLSSSAHRSQGKVGAVAGTSRQTCSVTRSSLE